MIQFFLNKKTLVKLVTIFIFFAGVMMLMQINRTTYPPVDFDILHITTSYPGASAEDVEVNVTQKLEDEIKTVTGVDKIRSYSSENVSTIFVWVDANADDKELTKDEIRRAVDRVSDLPQEVDQEPVIEELKSSNVAVISIAVSGTAPEKILRKVAKDLEEKINEIPGVGSINMEGYRDREVKILVDAHKIEQYYVSLNTIIAAIKNRNIKTSGGNLESYTHEQNIITFSEFNHPLDVRDVIVRENFDGKQLKLLQVAAVQDDFEEADVMTRTVQKNSINLLIRSQAKSDLIDISSDIKELVSSMQKNLPDNVAIEVIVDFSRYTASLLGMVQKNALMGFVLVLVVLFVFLNYYTGLWTAFGIPISFLGAVLLFPLFGVDINFISLITLVLVLGMLVDDAIVVAENISRYREMGMSPLQAASLGAKEVVWPVTATIVTTIIAFSSLYFMKGITGKFVVQIPIVVTLTLLMSLFECLFILPSHIAHSPKEPPRKMAWFQKLKSLYLRLVHVAIRKRGVGLLCFTGFLVSAILIVFLFMKVELFPYDDVDVFYVVAEMPDGTSLEETSQRMKRIEKLVSHIPRSAMESYTTTVGHFDRNVYAANSGLRHNRALITVYLKPAQDRSLSSEEIMEDLDKELKQIQGFKRLFLDKFNDGPPIGKPITITFVSSDDQLRRSTAQQVFDFLKQIDGVLHLEFSEQRDKEELLLKPDYELMARLGVTSRDLAETIRAAYHGVVVTSITREGEEIDFRVQLKKDQRGNIDFLKNLQLQNQQGKLIKIGTFTRLESSKGYRSIRHYNGRRAITISGDIDPKKTSTTEINQMVRHKFQAQVDSQAGIRMIFGGAEQATQESFNSFYIALFFAMIAIYFVLVILFDSFLQPLIIVGVVPFGFAGVVYTYLFHGLPISFLCMIGTLGLVGVMVNDSLIMVSHLNDLRREHRGLTLDLLVSGCQTRLRPVLLTTITTLVGLIPTAYGIWGYEPFIVPLVLALAGGLVFATPITLLLVPMLYSFGIGSSYSKTLSKRH